MACASCVFQAFLSCTSWYKTPQETCDNTDDVSVLTMIDDPTGEIILSDISDAEIWFTVITLNFGE